MRKTFAIVLILTSCVAGALTTAEARQERGDRASAQRANREARAISDRAALALELRLRAMWRLRNLPVLPPDGTHQIIDNPDPIGQTPANPLDISGSQPGDDTPDDAGGSNSTPPPNGGSATPPGAGSGSGGSGSGGSSGGSGG
jgi:uncharacterized membrane protein YgcG